MRTERTKKRRFAVGTEMMEKRKLFIEEDDEFSYTRVGRFGVKGD